MSTDSAATREHSNPAADELSRLAAALPQVGDPRLHQVREFVETADAVPINPLTWVKRTVRGRLHIAAVLALAGLLLCFWAAYQYLAILWGPIAAALVVGLSLIVVAGFISWIMFRRLHH